ncbi:MAG: hypothetical protein D6814_08055 [Calditrichaeota bacterium]|nr:MAG: hypothetical protein D6814_08055 [Calditrichota bacterium]
MKRVQIAKNKSAVALVYVVLCASFWMGCGAYSFSGSAYPHIKSIAVPLFADRTAEFGVKEELTNSIIEAFTRDNTLKIADRRNADSILNGTLLSLTERPGAYNRQEQVQEIQVYLTVEIQYKDLKKRKIIWEDKITQFGTYVPGDSQKGTREAAISEAISKIVDEVLNRTVSGW